MMRDSFFRFGQMLMQLRHKSARSQQAVAEAAGLRSPRLCAMERGRLLGPSPEVVDRLSVALHLAEQDRFRFSRVAARDRVMREAIGNLPVVSHAFLAAALDAAVELSEDDLQELGVVIAATVEVKAHLRRFPGVAQRSDLLRSGAAPQSLGLAGGPPIE